MSKILLCSEGIVGVEGLSDLAACAAELSAQGHTISMVCSNLMVAGSRSEFDGIALFQAPVFNGFDSQPLKQTARYRNLSELLLAYGFGSVESLTPVLRAWLHLLSTLDVDHIISDHAPTALLASRLLSISSVMIGDGFAVPPMMDPPAGFKPWRTEPEKLAQDQSLAFVDNQILLKSINGAFSGLGYSDAHIKSPFEVYGHAAQWLMSVPEMDHYGKRDLPYVVRWPSTNSLSDPIWPACDGERVFVVINATSPYCKELLSQLHKLDLSVLVVVEDATAEFINHYSSGNLKIQREMVSVRSVAEHCKIVVTHGDHDLVYELLLMGVPSVLLPYGIQNTLLTYRLAKKRLGFAGPSKPSRLDVGGLIETTRTVDQVWHNASRFSLKYQTHTSLTRLHELLKALCLIAEA
jgi:hypothetical protein